MLLAFVDYREIITTLGFHTGAPVRHKVMINPFASFQEKRHVEMVGLSWADQRDTWKRAF